MRHPARRSDRTPKGVTVRAHLIVDWVATTLIGLETLAGGVTDLARGRAMLVSGPFVLDIITHLGYPPYFLTILGVWKTLGAIVLFAPGLPRLKEWAYAGVIFELTGAAASFVAHGDPANELIVPLILASLALISWALRPPSRRLGVILRRRTPWLEREAVQVS
jgi:DoxX-like family